MLIVTGDIDIVMTVVVRVVPGDVDAMTTFMLVVPGVVEVVTVVVLVITVEATVVDVELALQEQLVSIEPTRTISWLTC